MSRDTRTSRRTLNYYYRETITPRWRLLPADYCQLGTADCPPADTNGIGLESVMWFGDKALVLRATVADRYPLLPAWEDGSNAIYKRVTIFLPEQNL